MLTTSQRIALRFALTIAAIVFFLGVVINLAFFWSRWKREQQFFRTSQMVGAPHIPQAQLAKRKFARKNGGHLGPRNMLMVPTQGEEQKELHAHTVFGNVAHFDDERYVYGPTPQGDQLLVVDISPVVHNQINLLRITLIGMLATSSLGYLVAIITVKKWLCDLHILAEKVKLLDIDSLHTQKFAFSHLPAHDEIQIVAHALDATATKVHNQVTLIQQFVANVSHEFKTPLMSLQSTLEVGERTKNYADVFGKVREEIGVMQRLLDTLTVLTRSQHDLQLEKNTFSLPLVLRSLVDTMQVHYPAVTFLQHIDEQATLHTHQWFFERIITNILDNAGKFTPAWGTVEIQADRYGIQIADTWSGISPEQLTRIREPFWQGDAARGTTGFGLGLSLVKQLVMLLDRDIILKSKIGAWTSVTIKR